MNTSAARQLVQHTFQQSFDRDRFYRFAKELLNRFEDTPFVYRGNFIPDAYAPYVETLERIGKYQDSDGKKIDLLVAILTIQLTRKRSTSPQFVPGSQVHSSWPSQDASRQPAIFIE